MRSGAPMWNANSYSNSDLTPGPSASPHPRGANAAHFHPASVHPLTAPLHMSVVHLHYGITPLSASIFPFPKRCTSLQQQEFNQTENRRYRAQRRAELQRLRAFRDFEWRPQPRDGHCALEWFPPSFEAYFIVLSITRNSRKKLILLKDVDHEMSPL